MSGDVVAPLEGATRRRFKRFGRLPVLRLVWNKHERHVEQ